MKKSEMNLKVKNSFPLFLKYPGIYLIFGLLYIVGGIIFGLLLVYPAVTNFDKDNIAGMILAFIMFGGFGLVYFLVGIRLIRKAMVNRKKETGYRQ